MTENEKKTIFVSTILFTFFPFCLQISRFCLHIFPQFYKKIKKNLERFLTYYIYNDYKKRNNEKKLLL